MTDRVQEKQAERYSQNQKSQRVSSGTLRARQKPLQVQPSLLVHSQQRWGDQSCGGLENWLGAVLRLVGKWVCGASPCGFPVPPISWSMHPNIVWWFWDSGLCKYKGFADRACRPLWMAGAFSEKKVSSTSCGLCTHVHILIRSNYPHRVLLPIHSVTFSICPLPASHELDMHPGGRDIIYTDL